MGAVYASIPVLPIQFQSSLNNIFLFQLFHAEDLKVVANNIAFANVIKELQFLETDGITIKVNNIQHTIFFKLAVIQGDNLGIHTLLGFSQGFRATYFCRFCKTSKNNTAYQTVQEDALL